MVKEKIKKKTVKKSSKKKLEDSHNNILKGFFIIFGIIFLLIVGFYILSYFISNFTYEGIDFKIVKEGDLIFYNTAVPVMVEGRQAMYNFYLRNDPRKLDVPFYGELKFKENMVINSTGDLQCEGKGTLAVANILNLYQVMGTKVIKDENATCDKEGRYIFLQITEGNETKIQQFGPACYNIEVNNCEVLEAAERFMIENLIKINKVV